MCRPEASSESINQQAQCRFERNALEKPNSIALTFEGQDLTYGELNEQANHLAGHLRGLGVGPEVPVALFLDRSPEMVVAIIAVLKARGCYVPIDLAYPAERIAFMLEDTGTSLILTQTTLRSRLPTTNAQVLSLDQCGDAVSRECDIGEPNRRPVSGSNAAYIMYTSGSTGKPKGVIVTHHNVVRLFEKTEQWFHFCEGDTWPLFHSYTFDLSVWEMWGALSYGGRLVIVPYNVSRSPVEFYQLVSRERVTMLTQTPSAFRQFLWAEKSLGQPQELALRFVIFAGEALEFQSLKPWFDTHGDQQPLLVNMYGITEITVHATYRVVTMEDLATNKGSLIGVPIPDLQIHLLDEHLKRVPDGTPGEICVGGDGVARGYLNRAELTQSKFVRDPFRSDPGAKLYRSGDLARVCADGELEYLGRMDHQVKIRGFRVEMGEVESALNQHPSVKESVVITRNGTGGETRLVAYLVTGSPRPNISELRQFLGERIPPYMIPATVMYLESLPLNVNGKVDRRALPEPDESRPVLSREYVAPHSPPECLLAEIWQSVLEIKAIGVNDNFFELGGDSIRSIRILAGAAQKGLHFSLEQLFQNPTIATLAECPGQLNSLNRQKRTEPFELVAEQDRALLPRDAEDAYPITRLQMGMFYRNELNPVSAIYHDIFSFRIRAPWNEELLRLATTRLAVRHAILRTSFHLATFSEPLQIVHASASIPFIVEDIRGMPPADQKRNLIDWVEKEKRHPFERAAAPLVRFHLQRWADDSFHIIISFHHACLDGWSLAALVTELFGDYHNLLQGTNAEVPGPALAYRDFVALEQEAIRSEPSRQYWLGKLRDANFDPLPRWPKELCAQAHEQARGPELRISPEVMAGLKRLAGLAGVPIRTVLLAAHYRVMALLTGRNDIVSGLLSSGRPESVDGDRLIGLFLNTLPIRLQMNGGTWLGLVKQTFAEEQGLIPHRRFPLAEIQKATGGKPVFEAAVDFVHFHVYKDLQGRHGLELAESHYFEANDLTTFTTFALDAASNELQMHIDYDPNVICRQQIEEMSRYYLNILAAMEADPEARYELFSPLTEEERRRLLVSWNETETDCPSGCIHELVAKTAERSPDGIALVFEGKPLTYADLIARSDALATHLQQAGVGPGDLVAICLERSAHLVIALLGILKAGAAYVPLDPAFPRERLALMLEDAKPRLILSQRSFAAYLPATASRVLWLDDLQTPAQPSTATTSPKYDSATQHDPETLAYVIYTSGSTGKPKGVQVTHRSVVNLLSAAAKILGANAADNFLAVTTISFDISVLEIFLPLTTGGTLTLAPREAAGDGALLANLIESSRASLMQSTPATWRLLIESGWKGRQTLRIICGGEALSLSLADELTDLAGEVWNFYGPTETTIWSTCAKISSGERISIGRPLANTVCYILGERLQPVPAGAIGELFIGGAGVARGYLNRPELTAERFLPDPFRKGGHIYKTGDLARYLPDGSIECLGRVDNQVKIRGFRIELGDIEAALQKHPVISACVVSAPQNSFGENRLVAYILAAAANPPSGAELRDFLGTSLPAYMIPAQFVHLEKLPRTPNGKVDRKQLPLPEELEADLALEYVSPRDPEEQALEDIWQEVLQLPRVGVTSDLFGLGVDSLSATRAFARINNRFSTNLTLRDILENPTIISLVEVIRHEREGGASASTNVAVAQRG